MKVSKQQNSQEMAIQLRRTGMTLSEIASALKVSKGAISKWLKGVNFSNSELQLINKKVQANIIRARNKSKLTKQMKRVFGERESLIEAQNEFKKYKKNELFLTGLSLYWTQCSFTNDYFQFTSSDTEMLKIILVWMQKYLHIKAENAKYRLFLNNGADVDKISLQWATSLLLPLGNFMSPVVGKKKTKISKSGLNKGSIQIIAYGIEYIRKIKVWQKLLVALLS